jgi:BlaI family penicillinase repressor
MAERVKISDAEWEAMKIVWEKPPVSASDVADILAKTRKWSPRTTKTVLNLLVKKGALTYVEDGRRFLFKPRISQEECVKQATKSFISRVFDGATAPLLVHFVKSAELSSDDIEQLKKILKEKEK